MYENFKKFTMLEDQPTTASDSTGNTDGEYTLRIEKEAIAFADSIEVNSIATHTGLVKGYIAGAKELASLREQLKQRDKKLERLNNDLLDALDLKNGNGPTALSMLSEKLKQKEDENRELVNFLLAIPIDPVYWVEYDSLIRKHKKNLSA